MKYEYLVATFGSKLLNGSVSRSANELTESNWRLTIALIMDPSDEVLKMLFVLDNSADIVVHVLELKRVFREVFPGQALHEVQCKHRGQPAKNEQKDNYQSTTTTNRVSNIQF